MKKLDFSCFSLFMESIKAVQAQNIYRVHPVNLFENRQQKNAETNIFAGNSGFNPAHPAVQSPTTARSLDILA